ncbi:MAG: transposase [Proteobacteria bacterium]|nr:transposase [Pseudomonadota bacterium]
MTTLREKLVKIGAKVVRHGRYVTFQMAEVAIPRALFAEILRLIKGQIAIYQSGLRPGSFTSSVVL